MKCVVLGLLCLAAVVAATNPEESEWVFAEIVDDVHSHMEAFKRGDLPQNTPALMETGAYAPMFYHPGFYPPVAPGYYGYFGYQPTYSHPYVSNMPRYMAVGTSADPPIPHPGATALAAYAQYGFPYSSFPPIPPPMPTYLPPPPYIPPDGFNADGLSGGAAAGGKGAGAAPAAAPAAAAAAPAAPPA